MCGMNAVRSPMAERLACAALPSSTFMASAGVRRGEPDPFVTTVLGEIALDGPRSPPRVLDELDDLYFDLIVTLSPEAHHTALELTRSMAVEVEYWPTADPTIATGTREQILDAYRDVRDRLKARIAHRFEPQGPPPRG